MSPPLPFYSVVQGLKNTPPEVVHQVLDDLRLYDILRLASHNDPSINYSIMAHPSCKKVFDDDFDNLYSVRDNFVFYRDFCRLMRFTICPSDSILALDANLLITTNSTTGYLRADDPYKKITYYFTYRLTRPLDLYRYQQEILARYARKPENLSQVWDSSQFSNIKTRWEEVQAAQERVNALRVHQLKRAAELLEANPDILKRGSDPEQKRRPNMQHILTHMHAAADRISGSLLIRDHNSSACYFKYMLFPVVPFDTALDFVAETLEKRVLRSQRKQSDAMEIEGPNDDAKAICDELSSIRSQVDTLINYSTEKPDTRDTESESQPESKAPIWTLQTPSLIASTEGTDQSTKLESQKPCFVHRQGFRQPGNKKCGQFKAWEPHDERELEWLEAFVEVYRYFNQG